MKMDDPLWIVIVAVIALFLFIQACTPGDQPSADHSERINHPEWTIDANIYEVNIRQYTPEGTLNAFRDHLPRLKEMGVEIIWLMPIHPIGARNRKGELGSYYSIRDYRAVNPRFGTMEDFQALVDAVHEHDMKLIMDWVPNHTAWDHPWVSEHPEYYAKDSTGSITYEADWTDIALLNYENRELWTKMTEAMRYWVEEADIDGFRVDHAAHEIPMAFWHKAIPQVNQAKDDLFWLAEWDDPKLHPLFDASYTWEYFHMTTNIAAGKAPLSEITDFMQRQDTLFPDHAYRMYFTSNHDENSWNGTDEQLFGDNFRNFAVLAATIDGMPLIYGGQETGLDQQLEFFRKDTIDWDGNEHAPFYSTLLHLKKENKALWNGQYGGKFNHIPTEPAAETYAYYRTEDEDTVLVILNFSDRRLQVSLEPGHEGEYTDAFTGETVTIGEEALPLGANSYKVLQQ